MTTPFLRIGPVGGGPGNPVSCPCASDWGVDNFVSPSSPSWTAADWSTVRVGQVDLISVDVTVPAYAPGAIYGFTVYWNDLQTNEQQGSVGFGGMNVESVAQGYIKTNSFYILPGDFLIGVSGRVIRSWFGSNPTAFGTASGAFALFDGLYELKLHSMYSGSLVAGSGELLEKNQLTVTGDWIPGDASPTEQYPFSLMAPTGYHVIGFMAHQGSLIDGIGLICAPLPVGVPAPVTARLRSGGPS